MTLFIAVFLPKTSFSHLKNNTYKIFSSREEMLILNITLYDLNIESYWVFLGGLFCFVLFLFLFLALLTQWTGVGNWENNTEILN